MGYRKFGRMEWEISELGHGMWGMGGWTGRAGGWTGSDDVESLKALHKSVELGINFFDTAWTYGEGHSEQLLSKLLKDYPNQKLYVATKIPPKNFKWPAEPSYKLDDVFPPEHIKDYTEKSLKNLGLDQLDLIQFHVWDDTWADDESWQRAVKELKDSGLIKAFGISVDRWEPENVIKTLRTGLVDSVQVIYNIFDQAPEDELFPVCRELNIAVIARVPFDEGTLTGTLTKDSKWEEGDFRSRYFAREKLIESVDRAKKIKEILPDNLTLAEAALRFIWSNPDVSITIPGMRKVRNVESNVAANEKGKLDPDLLGKLRVFRWDRRPASSV